MVTDQTTGSGGRIRPAADAAAGHPPAARTDVPSGWDERTVLTSMLDYARATVHAKCAGITEADARRAPLATSPLTTISGLVSHLRLVEDGWFSGALLAAEYDNPCTTEDPIARCASPSRSPSPGTTATLTSSGRWPMA